MSKNENESYKNSSARLYEFVPDEASIMVNISPENYSNIQDCVRILRPHKALGYSKIRIGARRDGGYAMIDDFEGIKVAISAGVGVEDTWEKQISGRNILVEAFDPIDVSDDTLRPYNLYKQFFNVDTLDEFLDKYNDFEAIAKIDIEGGEWDIFYHTEDKTWNKIRQFCCELHIYDSWLSKSDSLKQIFSRLNDNFKLIHIHANNNHNHYSIGNQNIPCLIECTFANRNYYDLSASFEVFPTNLDAPNFPNRGDDIYLGMFMME